MAESTLDQLETPAEVRASLQKQSRIGEKLIEGGLFFAGVISVAVTLGIVYILVKDAIAFFQLDEVTLIEFFTDTVWQPQIGRFGVLPLLNATLMISFIAMLVALPLGLGTAIYLSEYASPRVRNTIKPILEVLAGIPTVVFGYFALTFMTPLLRNIFGDDVVQIYNVASAGIVLAS